VLTDHCQGRSRGGCVYQYIAEDDLGGKKKRGGTGRGSVKSRETSRTPGRARGKKERKPNRVNITRNEYRENKTLIGFCLKSAVKKQRKKSGGVLNRKRGVGKNRRIRRKVESK